jgi:multiple antibiotic resistance protein
MVYLSLTSNYSTTKKRSIALKSPLIAFIVLSSFIYLGPGIIEALGIQPASLYIAGGILLFLIAVDLLFGKPRRTKASDPEEDEDENDPTVFPLALPLLSGPGAITAVLLFLSDHSGGFWFPLTLQLVVGLVLALGTGTMLISSYLAKVLRKTGVMVIERIMGILLSGMSVQFVLAGLEKLGMYIPS